MDTDGADLIAAVEQVSGSRLLLATRPGVLQDLPEVPHLLAGVSQVDLTPPPGLPKAGYSRNAHTGTGFRTRLRATVLHLRHGHTSLALIATDLLAGSALVQHLIAAQVAASTDVPLAGLFLSATHTHGAPGQFHGTDFYNRFSSNRPGLDPAWTALVARRIAAAVTEAVTTRAPASLAWGQTELTGVTRNRSLPAYRRNPGHEQDDAGSAINPDLNLVRVDTFAPDGGSRPLAAFAFFSVHGTAVPMSSRTYNADLWAYLYAELAAQVGTSHGPVTVAAVQGTHGDVTPALEAPAGHPEAARIGRSIGAAAASLYTRLDAAIAAPGARSPRLGVALREVDLATAPVIAGERLPRRPAVGAALLAGARENETPMISRIPPFRAGAGKRFRAGSEQGAKWVLGSRWGQPLVLPVGGFPRVLPIHLVRVGEVLLTGLPMEITLETGRRIAARAEQSWAGQNRAEQSWAEQSWAEQNRAEQNRAEQGVGGGAGVVRSGGDGVRSVVCSVVDEYAGYCTTEHEYAAQFYEGGHTLYGPGTQRFLGAVVADLAGRLAQQGDLHEALPQRRFDLAVRRYLASADAVTEQVVRRGLGAPVWGTAGAESCLEWTWLDAAPGDLCWHEPMVTLEKPDGTLVTDQHGELEVEYQKRRSLTAAGTAHRYVVRWFPGERGHFPGERGRQAGASSFRFVLSPRGGWPEPLRSDTA